MNVKRQIEVFMEEETDAKVTVIIQGWGIDDYNEYARGVYSVFEELDTETRDKYYEYIDGISIGNSLFISYFNMLDIYCRAPIDLVEVPAQHRNRIHVLGLSGASRTGLLYALNDDFFGRDIRFSFDGTSRTSSSVYGRYTRNKKTHVSGESSAVNLGTTKGPLMESLAKDMQREFGDILDILLNEDISNLPVDEMMERFMPWNLKGSKKIMSKDVEGIKEQEYYINKFGLGTFMHWLVELGTYLDESDKFSVGDFSNIGDKEYRDTMLMLSRIENYEEYMEKREWFQLKLKNKRLPKMMYVKTIKEFDNIIASKYSINEWL